MQTSLQIPALMSLVGAPRHAALPKFVSDWSEAGHVAICKDKDRWRAPDGDGVAHAVGASRLIPTVNR
jgi:hypothetical protein